MARVEFDDSKLNRFTQSAKTKLLEHVEEFGEDLIKRSIRLTNESENRQAEVTISRVDDAKIITRKYATKEKGYPYYIKFSFNIFLALVSGGMIGEIIGKIDKLASGDILFVILTAAFVGANIYLSVELVRES
ncbi:hypothetical protein [uncultured Deinococcus sp.]|uniref:hypothetical protein n=1 Tax=uncultured Deinococcus sp. TaxID=158789 RepID=UPI002582F19F|nr:hypothetical protein [uncultured Deinococcus sp.]